MTSFIQNALIGNPFSTLVGGKIGKYRPYLTWPTPYLGLHKPPT